MRTRRERVVRKRRQTFARLLVAALATLVLGLIPPLRALLVVHLILDVALAGYVYQLRRWALEEKSARARARRAPVEPQPAVAQPEPEPLVQEDSDEFAFRIRRSS